MFGFIVCSFWQSELDRTYETTNAAAPPARPLNFPASTATNAAGAHYYAAPADRHAALPNNHADDQADEMDSSPNRFKHNFHR